MAPTGLAFGAAALVLVAAIPAAAEPAYVPSTVNLRDGAGTGKQVLAKIPGGSRVEATNCADWCEVEWQGQKGYVIANALDRSGRTPEPRQTTKPASAPRTATRTVRRPPRRAHVMIEDDYVPVGPPVVYRPYYYGYRPYYYGYRPYYYDYGYRRYRRW